MADKPIEQSPILTEDDEQLLDDIWDTIASSEENDNQE